MLFAEITVEMSLEPLSAGCGAGIHRQFIPMSRKIQALKRRSSNFFICFLRGYTRDYRMECGGGGKTHCRIRFVPRFSRRAIHPWKSANDWSAFFTRRHGFKTDNLSTVSLPQCTTRALVAVFSQPHTEKYIPF